MITRNFNLFLNAGNSIPLVINVNQFDSGEQWVFTLFNSDGTQYIPSTGAIVGIKSDGLGIINSGSVNESGQVVISETQQMTAAVGKAVFELMIDNQTHGTANFVVLVEEKPGNNADLSESDLSLLEEAISATSPLPTGGTVGQVLTKTANGSTWSDAGTPTQEQVADAVSDWADEHITVTTGVVIDDSLSVAGAAADAKATGDELADLKSAIQRGGSFNAEVKSALDAFTASVLQLAEKVAYIDGNGQDYYDDIDTAADALHSAMYPPVNLSSISAVYTQSGAVYDTDSLDSLKPDLVVTAHYSDSTTATVTNYVLSGTLTTGTSTITVAYGGKTTTFSVTVTHDATILGYVSDGLIAMWDGIKNDGINAEHDSTTTSWVDVASGLTLEPASSEHTYAFGENYMQFSPNSMGGQSRPGNAIQVNGTALTRTVEVLFKTDDTSNAQFIANLTGDTSTTANGMHLFGITPSDGTVLTKSNEADGRFTIDMTKVNCVTAVYDSSNVCTGYVNGSSATVSSNVHSFSVTSGIGRNVLLVGSSYYYSFKGKIYSIRLYNRELTASEIAANYANDVSRFGLS